MTPISKSVALVLKLIFRTACMPKSTLFSLGFEMTREFFGLRVQISTLEYKAGVGIGYEYEEVDAVKVDQIDDNGQ